jgi:2,4-dienoyl-CoA reductase (NADPH2)
VDWLTAECRRLGVTVETGRRLGTADLDAAHERGTVVVVATGSSPGRPTFELQPGAVVVDILDLRAGRASLPDDGPVVVHDPIGGPIAVALAEELGSRAVLVTPDNIAGNELSRSGDLAPANVRLQQRGVRIERRSVLRSVGPDHVTVEDRFTGEQRRIDAVAVVDCGFRLPEDSVARGAHHPVLVAGDAVAPRTYLEAVLDGRRAALAVDAHR